MISLEKDIGVDTVHSNRASPRLVKGAPIQSSDEDFPPAKKMITSQYAAEGRMRSLQTQMAGKSVL